MIWRIGHRFSPGVAALADRHYSRQTVGARQCLPPGRAIVLLAGDPPWAVWATLFREFVLHEWPGTLENPLFRVERAPASPRPRASDMILEALSVTRYLWGAPPMAGIITFVALSRVASEVPGYCYRRAGWRRIGFTRKRGHLVLHLPPDRWPQPRPPLGEQLSLWGHP